MSLRGRNTVITGATRGIGRGIAIGCGEQGANVFITGRTEHMLQHVAAEVRAAGGNCEYFVVDHDDDDAVRRLFDALESRLAANGASLHMFVNNAYAAVSFLVTSAGVPFWKKDVDDPALANDRADPGRVWDKVNGVGLRNNFVCASRVLRMMERQGEGLIVNITSWAGLVSLFDPAYSVGKEAVERMSAEIAISAPPGVYSLALCPGFVTTESLKIVAEQHAREVEEKTRSDRDAFDLWNAETPLFVGRVAAALASDRAARLLPSMNGKVVIACEAAAHLDICDENNFRALSPRSLRYNALSAVPFLRTSPLRHLIPSTPIAPWFLVRSLKQAHSYWN